MKNKIICALFISVLSFNALAATSSTSIRQPSSSEMQAAGCSPTVWNNLMSKYNAKRGAEQNAEQNVYNNDVVNKTANSCNLYSATDTALQMTKTMSTTSAGSMYDMIASAIMQMMSNNTCSNSGLSSIKIN